MIRKPPQAGGAGALVVIVGPSGSGKDTLIAWLKSRVGPGRGVMFVRRTITRQADATEDHNAMHPAEFGAAQRAGRFAVVWQAHGLSYGIPVEALHHVRAGGTAICNGSRAALGEMRRVFENLRVFELTVAPEILSRRLRERGRESEADIARRLSRGSQQADAGFGAIAIDNSGPIEIAGQQILTRIDA